MEKQLEREGRLIKTKCKITPPDNKACLSDAEKNVSPLRRWQMRGRAPGRNQNVLKVALLEKKSCGMLSNNRSFLSAAASLIVKSAAVE